MLHCLMYSSVNMTSLTNMIDLFNFEFYEESKSTTDKLNLSIRKRLIEL